MAWRTLRQRAHSPSAQLDAGAGGVSGTNWEGLMVVNETSPCRVSWPSPTLSPILLLEGRLLKVSPAPSVVCWAWWQGQEGPSLGQLWEQWVPADTAAGVPLLAWAPSAFPPSSPLAELLPLRGQWKGMLREVRGVWPDFIPIPSPPHHPCHACPMGPRHSLLTEQRLD